MNSSMPQCLVIKPIESCWNNHYLPHYPELFITAREPVVETDDGASVAVPDARTCFAWYQH